MSVRLEQLLAVDVDKKARETWWSLNRMSYTGGQPDLRKQDVEDIASLIRDLAGLVRDSEERDRLLIDMGEALRSHQCERVCGYQLPVKVVGTSVFQDGDPEALPVESCATCALLARLDALGKDTT